LMVQPGGPVSVVPSAPAPGSEKADAR
jgi:hypothetical protein